MRYTRHTRYIRYTRYSSRSAPRRGLQLLPETILHRSKRGKWALIQLTAHTVQLEHEGGAILHIETSMRINGADLHAGHVVLWSGSQVRGAPFLPLHVAQRGGWIGV